MAKKSVEALRHPTLEIVQIEIDDIQPNPRNPNELSEDKMETLKRDIREFGFKQPILVRERSGPLDGGPAYELIDGEHRWRALRELAAETVPAVVIAAGDDDADLATISMNLLRGEFIPIKLALLLADLNKRIPEDELGRRLGMDGAEIKDNLRLAAFTDDLPAKVREARDYEERSAPEILRFVMPKRDAEVVERVIASLMTTKGEKNDRSKALVKLAREYERLAAGE